MALEYTIVVVKAGSKISEVSLSINRIKLSWTQIPGSGDLGLIPGIPSWLVGLLMTRILKMSGFLMGLA